MAFKGEISVGMLNSLYKTGFSVNDIYRVQGSGNLVPNNCAVFDGNFVKWTADGWEVQKNMRYALIEDTTAAADKATGFALAGDADDVLLVFVTAEVYATYTVGYYYSFNGTVCKCTDKTTEDDKYIVELTQVGVAGALTEITSLGGGSGITIYPTLQDAITDQANLPVGTIFETNGFHTSGDGGAARYLVSNTGTANGMDVITMATGKYALFQWSNEVTPEQLGAVGDGNTEDTTIFDYIVNYFSSVLGDMQVKRVIRGSMGKRYKVHALSIHDVCVSRCVFKGRGSTTGYGIRLGNRAIIEKCILSDFVQAIFTGDNDSAISAVVTGCTISWCGNGICLHSGTSQQKSVDNVLLENNYISRLGTLGHSSDSTPPSWDNTGCGIWLSGNWKNVSIVNNVLEYNGYAGLRLECNRTDLEPSCIVTENYFEGNKHSAIRIIMQKRPCMVSIFGNQMTKVNTNVFYTTGIYCTSVMSSSRIESPYGEYLGVATSNSGSDIISVNSENLKASNILIYPADLTSDTFQLIPAKCANSTSERKMLHLDVYARSSDSSFTMSVSYVDKNNVTQTKNVTIDTNVHQVIEIPLIDVNLYDSVNEPITCVVTSATWTYLMITDLWIK